MKDICTDPTHFWCIPDLMMKHLYAKLQIKLFHKNKRVFTYIYQEILNPVKRNLRQYESPNQHQFRKIGYNYIPNLLYYIMIVYLLYIYNQTGLEPVL